MSVRRLMAPVRWGLRRLLRPPSELVADRRDRGVDLSVQLVLASVLGVPGRLRRVGLGELQEAPGGLRGRGEEAGTDTGQQGSAEGSSLRDTRGHHGDAGDVRFQLPPQS